MRKQKSASLEHQVSTEQIKYPIHRADISRDMCSIYIYIYISAAAMSAGTRTYTFSVPFAPARGGWCRSVECNGLTLLRGFYFLAVLAFL